MKSFLVIIFILSGIQKLHAAEPELQNVPAQEVASSPSFGINADPIWLALGGFGVKFEYFANDTVSVGLGGILIPKRSNTTDSSTSTITTDDYKWEYSQYYIGSNIMLTGTLGGRGLYINPAVGVVSTKITEYGTSQLSGSLSAAMLKCTVGYQWVLMQHLRLAAGGGLMLANSSDIVIKDNSGAEIDRQESSALGGLAIDLQIGYVF